MTLADWWLLPLLLSYTPPKLCHGHAMDDLHGSSQEITAAPDDRQALVSVQASGIRRRSSHTMKRDSGAIALAEDGEDLDDVQKCWLCRDPFESRAGISTYRQKEVHSGCASAWRCHDRILAGRSDAAKKADNQRMLQDSLGWRNSVLELEPPAFGNRSTAIMKNHSAELEAFAEQTTIDDDLLLTKSRWNAWHHQWDGWGSETASEEFDQALSDQSGNETNSNGEPRVWQKENLRRQNKSGYRTTGNQSGSSARGRDRDRRGNSTNASAAGSRRQRRDGSRDGESRASRASRRRSKTRSRSHGGDEVADRRGRRGGSKDPQSGSPAGAGGSARRLQPRSSPDSKSGAGRQSRGSGNSPRVSSAASAGGNTGRAPHKRLRSKTLPGETVVDDAGTAQADEDDGAADPVAFLAKKAELKRKLEEKLKKLRMKTSVGKSLAAMASKMTPEQVQELKKTGDHEAILKIWDKTVEELTQLGVDLKDATQGSVTNWEKRFDQLVLEVSAAEKKGGYLR